MTGWTLRKQVLVTLGVLFGILCLITAASYRMRAKAHESLAAHFQQDLALLAELPRLRGALRRLELETEKYLLTGDAHWLTERTAAQEHLAEIREKLTTVLKDDQEKEIFVAFEASLAQCLKDQEEWIRLDKAGKLSRSEKARITQGRGATEKALNLVMSLRDVNIRDLRAQRGNARRVSLLTFWAVLGSLIAGGILTGLFMAYRLAKSLRALEQYAQSWTVGTEWMFSPSQGSSLEALSLTETLRKLTAQLNADFGKEQELNRFKSQLVSLVSHELNTAMTIIQGAAWMLTDSELVPGGTDAKHYGDMLTSNIRSLSSMTTNLLQMGRSESGKLVLSPHKIEISGMLRVCVERFEILTRRKELRVTLDLPETPVSVNADPDTLMLVMTNLLSNAIKYTPKNGDIYLGITPLEGEAGMLRIFFRDTGIGISPEDQKRILSGSHRTEEGKKVAKGFGIGLMLADKIIEAHGSRLEINSEPDKGSTFAFKLPIYDQAF